jgi:MSHA biogenesis protein MshN
MSLINQVLKDIDERRSAEHSDDKTDLDDLHFSHIPKRKSKAKPIIISSIVSLSVAAIIVTAFYLFQQSQTDLNLATSDAVVADHAPKPESTLVAKATAPVSAPKPVVTEVSQTKTKPENQKSATKARSTVKPVTSTIASEVDSDAASEEAIAVSEFAEESDDTPVRFTRQVVPMRPEQKAELSYQNGYDHLRSQRHRQAEQSLRTALVAESGHIKARELLSGIYIKQGRWIEASELLREGLTYSPEHLTFSKLYARALMQLNQDAQAIAVLKKYAPAVKSDPNYFAILAALYQRQNQHGHAADLYAKLVSVNPNKGVWWVGLGISLEATGRKQDALQAYGHARKTGNLHNEVARFTDNRLVALEEINFPSE